MTPMIDVVFLLLIFFVCTASFQALEEVLPSHLLAAGESTSDVEVEPLDDFEEIVVKVIWRDGAVAWRVNQRDCAALAEVRAVLQALVELNVGLPVILDADADVPLGHLIDVYDLCRIVGFEKIQFAAGAKNK